MKKCVHVFLFLILTYKIFGQVNPPSIPKEYSTDDVYSVVKCGKDEYRWKKNKEKLSGYISFSCKIGEGGGIYKGYEGEGLFINGFRHKKWTLKNCHSQLRYILNYNKGAIIGYYKVYYQYYKPLKINGNITNIKCDTILYETNFIEGNGTWKDFHDNKVLKEIGDYRSGKKEGVWFYYLDNSTLYLKRYFEKGIMIREEGVELPLDYKIQIKREL